MFLDDTACNLASLNLLQFRDASSGNIDLAAYEHATRLWTVVLEISVLMGAVPELEGDRAATPTTTARSASATPMSAAC